MGAIVGFAKRMGRHANQFGFRNPSRSLEGTGLDARSVAVLYFEDLSPDGELRYLADGLTEGLIRRLSRVGALDVVSRNGVQPYRGSGVSVDSVAGALRVGSVIRGSLEPRGDDISVTVRLADGASGVDVQRVGFSLPAGDFLAMADSIAHEASRILREWIGEEVRVRGQRA